MLLKEGVEPDTKENCYCKPSPLPFISVHGEEDEGREEKEENSCIFIQSSLQV